MEKKITPRENRIHWEDDRVITKPHIPVHFLNEINRRFRVGTELKEQRSRLKCSFEQIEAYQLEKIKELVKIAWSSIKVYRDKYEAAGITQADIDNFDWDVYKRLPVITKYEIIAAFPDGCLNPSFSADELFSTNSSGTSGTSIQIRNDTESIITDTWQGIRQLELQSLGRLASDDLVTHIYTSPW